MEEVLTQAVRLTEVGRLIQKENEVFGGSGKVDKTERLKQAKKVMQTSQTVRLTRKVRDGCKG